MALSPVSYQIAALAAPERTVLPVPFSSLSVHLDHLTLPGLVFNIIFISFPIFFTPNYHLAANPKEFLYYS